MHVLICHFPYLIHWKAHGRKFESGVLRSYIPCQAQPGTSSETGSFSKIQPMQLSISCMYIKINTMPHPSLINDHHPQKHKMSFAHSHPKRMSRAGDSDPPGYSSDFHDARYEWSLSPAGYPLGPDPGASNAALTDPIVGRSYWIVVRCLSACFYSEIPHNWGRETSGRVGGE